MVKSVYRFRAAESPGPRYTTGVRGTLQTAEDIIPIAELKANMSEIVRGLDARPRPLVVTLNGKPAAVVMSPREYDLLSYQARFIEAVNEGLADTAAGRTEDAEEVFSELLNELKTRHPRRARSRARK